MRTRRGFTLVELLIGIIIFGIVGGAIFGLLTRSQRLSRTQADRAVMQANIRAGMNLITSELRELNVNATASDLYTATTTGVTYRGMRGLGFVCDIATGYARMARGTFNGYRDPVAGRDSVLIFVDHNTNIATDDGWLARNIASVQNENCSSGTAGIRLNFTTSIPTADTLTWITAGSPIRTFEVMEVAALVQGGETWLGARSVTAGQALQPVLGPLNLNGVAFQYRTAAGVAGASPLTVRTIQLTLTGITDNIVAAQAGTSAWTRATEQLVTTIQLRNAP